MSSSSLTPRMPAAPPTSRPSVLRASGDQTGKGVVSLPQLHAPAPPAGSQSRRRGDTQGLLTPRDLTQIRNFISANRNMAHQHRRGNLSDCIPQSPFRRTGQPCDTATGLALETLHPLEPAIDVTLRLRPPAELRAPNIVEPLSAASQVERLFAFMKGQSGSGSPRRRKPKDAEAMMPEPQQQPQQPRGPMSGRRLLRQRDYDLRAFAARRAGQRRQEAIAYYCMAALAYSSTDFTGAGTHLDKAIAVLEELGDACGLASAHNLAGAARHRAGDYEAAISHHQKQEALCGAFGKSVALVNIGVCYSALRDREAASTVLAEAVDQARLSGDMCIESIALGNLGLAHLKQGNLKGAQLNLEACMEICSVAGDHTGAAACLLLLGEVYALVHDHKHAQFYFANAFRVATDGGAKDIAQVARVNLGVAIGNEQYSERCAALASVMQHAPSPTRLLSGPA
eukprot:TRINITY_DN15867_c0_g1_i1.p1 TRINITY_DN15867_c0_g1~~TRINITY_DN15867_c0_g1_i1.p1  ORF type:complete len:473 (+),score=128.04 TRINITY_DN15867_c0_g1_i1:57-1421(+)